MMCYPISSKELTVVGHNEITSKERTFLSLQALWLSIYARFSAFQLIHGWSSKILGILSLITLVLLSDHFFYVLEIFKIWPASIVETTPWPSVDVNSIQKRSDFNIFGWFFTFTFGLVGSTGITMVDFGVINYAFLLLLGLPAENYWGVAKLLDVPNVIATVVFGSFVSVTFVGPIQNEAISSTSSLKVRSTWFFDGVSEGLEIVVSPSFADDFLVSHSCRELSFFIP
ncbi:hypothetical protein V6N13_042534 [Hibiscus sabdariffa]